ncbi:DNA gyrase inhibitor YacG [Marinibactrum halimedae]|uniref:DNA gyrase inhibitor YacG n=1 Tax=Marinibactrum halimedae TaxID=1444977 RepID=A0AA37WNU2_9GAMM|nr:DNA gyrase inhibitor YacG [Marinibactrum halimedae]MCD9460232.1 DNA gyrase inhibitor YacG [Marinibactrum halimedae]GLS27935.1 DNA gyrase inhibitor YacG [Marinibactrum halimedae]
MSNKATLVQCPTCQTKIEWSEKHPNRPFCSERCKLIDLGEWASENRRIPGSNEMNDVFSEELINSVDY